MRSRIVSIALFGLVIGLVGAWAYGELHGEAGATPAPSQVVVTGPLDGAGNVKVHEQGTANVNVVSMPAAPQGRLIQLGTQTIGNLYRSAFVDVSDCHKATIMVTSSNSYPTLYVNPQISPDGVQAIAGPAGELSDLVIDGVRTRSLNGIVTWPIMRVEAYLNPAETSNITAWIWCQP